MKILEKSVLFLFSITAFAAIAEIRTAGDLLVDLRADTIVSLSEGAPVSLWQNAGTLQGGFRPFGSGSGVTYTENLLGVKAVSFSGFGETSVLKSDFRAPDEILGANPWSVEIWILCRELLPSNLKGTYFAWTPRGALSNNGRTVMEMRWCDEMANAVEHWADNIPWGVEIPLSGIWHHIAVTRDTGGMEKLFVDGVLSSSRSIPNLNLQGKDGAFTIGGILDRGKGNGRCAPYMFFKGAIAAIRVHSGTLSDQDVVSNYMSEAGRFGCREWGGASGGAPDWNEPSNWLTGNVPGEWESISIKNGGEVLLTNSVTARSLELAKGTLTLDDGASLTLEKSGKSLVVGRSGPVSLNILDGSLVLPGNGWSSIFIGHNGHPTSVVVGGKGRPALLQGNRDVIFDREGGDPTTVLVSTGGVVRTEIGWVYLACFEGASTTLTVEGGRIEGPEHLVMIHDKAVSAELIVRNGGVVDLKENLCWVHAATVDNARSVVRLEAGGTLDLLTMMPTSETGERLLYMDGGTIRCKAGTERGMEKLTHAYLSAGGVIVDVPAGQRVTWSQPLEADPDSPGGGLVKRGEGILILSGPPAISGNIVVEEGALLLNAQGSLEGFTGQIGVRPGAGIGCNRAGGINWVRERLTPDSSGATLVLQPANAADPLDLTGYPGGRLGLFGAFTYTGKVTLDPSVSRCTVVTYGADGFNPEIDAGTGFDFFSAGEGTLGLSGARDYTGSVLVDGCTLLIDTPEVFGRGGSPVPGNVTLTNNAALVLTEGVTDPGLVLDRLTPASQGSILLSKAEQGTGNLDLSAHPSLSLGAVKDGNFAYDGTLVPGNDGYRLGGGKTDCYRTSHSGLAFSTLSGEWPVTLSSPGVTALSEGNSYTGGTSVRDGAALFLVSDGLGALPETEDPENLLVDDGMVRMGPTNLVLSAERGVRIGPGGATFCIWGGSSLTLNGNLSGNGDILVNDDGNLTFGGGANSYTGRVTVSGRSRLTVGTGENFSWNVPSMTVDSTLALNMDRPSSLSTLLSGKGRLVKEGAGELTLTRPVGLPAFSVDGGGVRLAEGGGFEGRLAINAATVTVDRTEWRLDSLEGSGGELRFPSAEGHSLEIGSKGDSGTFSGKIPHLPAIVKTGAGKQVLKISTQTGKADVTVKEGQLSLWGIDCYSSARIEAGTLEVGAGERSPCTLAFDHLEVLGGKLMFAPEGSLAWLLPQESGRLGFTIGGGGPSTLLRKTGTGTLKLDDPDLDYRGVLRVEGGTLELGGGGMCGIVDLPENGKFRFNPGPLREGTGLIARYYDFAGNDRDYSPFRSVDGMRVRYGMERVSLLTDTFDLGTELTFEMNAFFHIPFQRADTFDLILEGFLFADNEGVYSFETAGDDGRALFVDTEPLCLQGTQDGSSPGGAFGEIYLTRGMHEISVIYRENTGNEGLFVRMKGPGENSYTPLPQLILYPRLGNGCRGLSGTGSVSLADWSHLLVDQDTPTTFSGSLEGGESCSIHKRGKGCLTLTSANTSYTGSLIVSGGILELGGTDGGIGSPKITVCGEGCLRIARQGSCTLPNALLGNGTLEVPAGTEFTPRDLSLFTGTLVVREGARVRIPAAVRCSGKMSVVNEGTLEVEPGGGPLPTFANSRGKGRILYVGEGGHLLGPGVQTSDLSVEAGSTLTLASPLSLARRGRVDFCNLSHWRMGGACLPVNGLPSGVELISPDRKAAGTIFFRERLPLGSPWNLRFRCEIGRHTSPPGDGFCLMVHNSPDGSRAYGGNGDRLGGALNPDAILPALGTFFNFYVKNGSNFELGWFENGEKTAAEGISAINPLEGFDVRLSYTGERFTLRLIQGETVLEREVPVDLNAFFGRDDLFLGFAAGRGSAYAELRIIDFVLEPAGEVLPSVTLDNSGLKIGPAYMGSFAYLSEWVVNGSALWFDPASPIVQMTPMARSQAGTLFKKSRVDISKPWTAKFHYRGGREAGRADGFSFMLHNSPKGPFAIGNSGGDLAGVKGGNAITPALGFAFNVYRSYSVFAFQNGSVGNTTSLNSLNLMEGVDVTVRYDGTTLTATVQDSRDSCSTTFSVGNNAAINIPAVLGTNEVWVGFTGATGGLSVEQFISDFSMEGTVSTSDYRGSVLNVSGESRLEVSSDETLLGDLHFTEGSTFRVSAPDSDILHRIEPGTLFVGKNSGLILPGNGRLQLSTIQIQNSSPLTISGGKILAKDNLLTIVLPAPLPKGGIVKVLDLRNCGWVGDLPAFTVQDTQGNTVDKPVYFNNGVLTVNFETGFLLMIR